ncbi:MAG: hypothetical protein ACRYFX_19545 [Janthinobacterium lividum]
MMRLVTVDTQQALLLPSELSLDIDNPSFEADAIPGTWSLPFELPWARENLVALNFPHLYRGAGGPPPVAVDVYLDEVRWRRGKLLYLSVDGPARLLRYNFITDASDLADAIKDVKLDALDLGTAPLDRTGNAMAYALLPVRNATFYGDKDKAPAAYKGYLNYHNGAYPTTAVLAPQPYLVPVLRTVLAHFGYELTGAWAADVEINQLVFYSDRLCLDPATVTLNRHVPAIDVADLLLGVAGLFCLQLYVNPLTRQVRLTPLRDMVAGAAAGQRARPGVWQSSTANTSNGFLLQQEPDGNDELDKTLDTAWQQLRVGAGGEQQSVKAGTLHQVDVTEGSRNWLVPAYEGKGAVPGNADVGDESRVGLRLLFNRGLQPDSTGQLYPLGTGGTVNQAGTSVGSYSLQWPGTQGLYQVWHKGWLDFRARAVQHVYQSELRVGDLLTLDPSQAELVDYHLGFWEKISLTVEAGSHLTSATFTYQELL